MRPLRASPSSAGRRPQHLHVVEASRVDQRLDEDVVLEAAAGLASTLLTRPTGMRGRERAVLRARGDDDLALGRRRRLRVDEVEHAACCCRLVPSPMPVAPLLLGICTPTPDSGSVMSEHRRRASRRPRARARRAPRPSRPACPTRCRRSSPLSDLDRALEVARRAVDDLGGDRVGCRRRTAGRAASAARLFCRGRVARRAPAGRRARSSRRRSRAFSSFSDAVVVTPSTSRRPGETRRRRRPRSG